jgi:hypothetical protein
MNKTAKLAIGVLGVVGLIAGGTVAYAAIPSADKVFTACVQKSTGALRLIDVEKNPPATCSNTEFKVTWNQQGQPGSDGSDGADGVSGYETIVADGSHTVTINGSGRVITPELSCPAGKVVLGATGHVHFNPGGTVGSLEGDLIGTDIITDLNGGNAVRFYMANLEHSILNAGDVFDWEITVTCANAT